MKLYIGIDEEGIGSIWTDGFELPNGTEIIVRDFAKGNVPDENGDLYEDSILMTVNRTSQ